MLKKISFSPTFNHIKLIAGVDASYQSGYIIGGIVILKYPELSILDRKYIINKVNFPYRSGLLTLREGPALINLFKKVEWNPDIIFFDGQGYAHPRRMGIATHLGLFLDRATIGCAKSRLIGDYTEPGNKKGCYSPLLHKEIVIGTVLRTRDNVKPIFVSSGNHINLKKAIEITLSCTTKFRIPVPIREAHLFVNKIRKNLWT
ncbi:MAG TPA: endonuclease V [Atribacterota bacterium]|nr:endonuclease V [Atribacterota bacterium]